VLVVIWFWHYLYVCMYDLNFPLNRFSKIFSNVRFTCARPAVFPYPPKKDPRKGQKTYKGGTCGFATPQRQVLSGPNAESGSTSISVLLLVVVPEALPEEPPDFVVIQRPSRKKGDIPVQGADSVTSPRSTFN
jgi:hypothetical protein